MKSNREYLNSSKFAFFLLLNFTYSFVFAQIENVNVGGTTKTSTIISGISYHNNARIELSKFIDFHDIEREYYLNFIGNLEYELYFKNSIENLSPNTTYYYRWTDNNLIIDQGGKFTTFPDGASNIKIIFGSCAYTGSNRKVFDKIREENAIIYINIGDFHYGNIVSNCTENFKTQCSRALNSERQSLLYRSTSFAYLWDDHDFGYNNSAGHPGNDYNDGDGKNASLGSEPCKDSALRNYKNTFSSYNLIYDNVISQSFSVGRLRIILSDLRAMKLRPVIYGCEVEKQGTMFGFETHLSWFLNELSKAKQNGEYIIWVSTVPYINDVGGPDYDCTEDDDWGGYREERSEIANFISDNKIDNIVIVSGDAHMSAIDSGANSDYSTNQNCPIPVLHEGALDQAPSTKGGPYSEGVSAKAGQYGVFEIFDNGGNNVKVKFTAKNEEGEVVFSDLGKELVFEEEVVLNSLNISAFHKPITDISIYPNPTAGKINLTINNKYKGKVKVILYDEVYKIVNKYLFRKNNIKESFEIDFNKINSEILFVHVIAGDNLQIEKIIISK